MIVKIWADFHSRDSTSSARVNNIHPTIVSFHEQNSVTLQRTLSITNETTGLPFFANVSRDFDFGHWHLDCMSHSNSRDTTERCCLNGQVDTHCIVLCAHVLHLLGGPQESTTAHL